MAAKTIADLWSAYERAHVPQDAAPVQRDETRKAFYAGAAAAMKAMTVVADGMSEDEACRYFDALEAEIGRFPA